MRQLEELAAWLRARFQRAGFADGTESSAALVARMNARPADPLLGETHATLLGERARSGSGYINAWRQR